VGGGGVPLALRLPRVLLPAGKEGAHEKGGVEHEGGRFRRSHLVPVPEVDTLTDLNERIEQIEAEEDARHIDNRPTSVGFDFAYGAPLLAPVPAEEFDVGLTLTPRVDKTSGITVRQNKYSVPARFIGRNVRVSLRANEVLVFEQHKVVVRHPRLAGRHGFRDLLDHYLEILRDKPGAPEHSTGPAAARDSGLFTPVHDAFWAAAREARGPIRGHPGTVDEGKSRTHTRSPAAMARISPPPPLAGRPCARTAGSRPRPLRPE
jgi:hypothetical protein